MLFRLQFFLKPQRQILDVLQGVSLVHQKNFSLNFSLFGYNFQYKLISYKKPVFDRFGNQYGAIFYWKTPNPPISTGLSC